MPSGCGVVVLAGADAILSVSGILLAVTVAGFLLAGAVVLAGAILVAVSSSWP